MSCYIDKRPESPNWYIYDYDERTGETRRFSARTADKQLAQKKLAAYLLGREDAKLKSNITLAYLVTRYWTLEGQFLASKDSVKAIMALVVEHEPDRMLFNWPKADQRRFIAKFTDAHGTPLSPSTQRRYFGVLKTAAKFLKEREEIASIPEMINLEVEDGPGARVMPVEVARTLFAHAIHLHEQLYLILEATTTPRPKHIIEATWERISWEDGVIDYRIPGARLIRKRDKLKRRAVAALCPAALAFLKAHRSTGSILTWQGKPLKTFGMTFKHLAERANIVGYSSYSLRKLGATYMRRNRVSELDIKTMLAHSIKGETGRYAQEEPEYLIDVRRIMQQLLAALDPPWLRPYLASKQPSPREQTFWSMTRPNELGCWIWRGALTHEGYGHTGCELAHRAAFELVHGPISNETMVRQRCGVRACCRPDHLFAESATDLVSIKPEMRVASHPKHHAALTGPDVGAMNIERGTGRVEIAHGGAGESPDGSCDQ